MNYKVYSLLPVAEVFKLWHFNRTIHVRSTTSLVIRHFRC